MEEGEEDFSEEEEEEDLLEEEEEEEEDFLAKSDPWLKKKDPARENYIPLVVNITFL